MPARRPSHIPSIDSSGEKVFRIIKEKTPDPLHIPSHYFGMGFYLLTPLLLGVIIGVSINRYIFESKYVVLVSILFGMIGVFYNLYRVIKDNAAAHQH